MPTIRITDGPTVEAEAGKRLVLALEDGGVDVLHRCGGNARCTTCRVVFEQGEPDQMTVAERDRLAARGLSGKVRLSCQIICDHDMTLSLVNRLACSQYDDPGGRPADAITPEARWVAVSK